MIIDGRVHLNVHHEQVPMSLNASMDRRQCATKSHVEFVRQLKLTDPAWDSMVYENVPLLPAGREAVTPGLCADPERHAAGKQNSEHQNAPDGARTVNHAGTCAFLPRRG